MESLMLTPIGIVRSAVTDPAAMPNDGVPAVIEVFPAYAAGLTDLTTNSHIWVIAWLDRADRTTLTIADGRGVFGLRSSARPNPLGLTATRLLAVDGRRLVVERLDFVDGTPVVDLKRYSPGWDAIFAATTSREFRPVGGDPAALARELFHEAEHFHGEACAGAALGARLIARALQHWQTGKRDPTVHVVVPADGCLADALQAITGATFGNGRLRCAARPAADAMERDVQLTRGGDVLRFRLADRYPPSAEAVLAAAEATLFRLESAV